MTNFEMEVTVSLLILDGINYGYYVGISTENTDDEEHYLNDDISNYFTSFGLKVDYRVIALSNGGYIDRCEWLDVDEYFFRKEADAKIVAEIVQQLVNTIERN